ncbi:response regulator [Aneurinibacillus uraniidurans]|uniref:response regulator n=1 Tax=Aneurinibacillus uraniidurans TaxID=2966586 RepID=UPI00234A194D|nr:response regulator [Aneurinibacillus sp. B1]WCN36985.1 response regulator [Aneurinibacillus sp. B1]
MARETLEQLFRKKYYAQLIEVQSRLSQEEHLQTDVKWREEIYRVLHSLKGTAGTLGFSNLTHIAETGLLMFSESHTYALPSYMITPLHTLINEAITYLRMAEHAHVSEDILQEMRHFNALDGKPKRILVIDDDEILLSSIHHMLSMGGFDVEVLSDPSHNLEEMLNRQPDCIILDIMMPDTDGFYVMQYIRNDVQREFTPVLMLTARADLTDKYKGFQLGADEYLTKPFHFEELMLRIKTLISRVEKYRSLTLYDSLTGLHNRRYLLDRLQELFIMHARKPQNVTLSIIDLDFFKRVNDTYGHPCGDTVLKSFASFLKEKLRETDIITRYGGEEFIVVLPDTPLEQAEVILNRVREDFSRTEIHCSCQNVSFFQTFSCGMAQIGINGHDITSLIEYADKALYLAKFKGRNRICLASELGDDATNGVARKKVLIADDDMIVHAILKNQLADTDWDLIFAKNGQEVLNIVTDITPDLFILDGMMPVLNGLEACMTLRKQPRFAKTPIIMLTGRDAKEEIAQALDTGVDDYVLKPFSAIELKARINRLFVRTASSR